MSNENLGLSGAELNEKIEAMLQESCEALSYAWYLARSAADAETDSDHAAYLVGISNSIKATHEEIMTDLVDRARPAGDLEGSTGRR